MNPRIHATIALLAGLTAISSTASADQLVVESGIATAYYNDASFDTVSEPNAYSEFALSSAWAFDRLAGLQLGVLFTAQPGRLQTSRFGGDLYVEWGRQRVLGTVGWGTDLWWFRPNVLLGVGYAHQALFIYPVGERLKDHAHDLTGQLSGGLDFNIPFGWGFMGVTTEVGYQAQTAATFDEVRHDRKAFKAEYEPEEDPWNRAEGNFGTLKTSGVFWSVGFNLTFTL